MSTADDSIKYGPHWIESTAEARCPQCALTRDERVACGCPMRVPSIGCPFYDAPRAKAIAILPEEPPYEALKALAGDPLILAASDEEWARGRYKAMREALLEPQVER